MRGGHCLEPAVACGQERNLDAAAGIFCHILPGRTIGLWILVFVLKPTWYLGHPAGSNCLNSYRKSTTLTYAFRKNVILQCWCLTCYPKQSELSTLAKATYVIMHSSSWRFAQWLHHITQKPQTQKLHVPRQQWACRGLLATPWHDLFVHKETRACREAGGSPCPTGQHVGHHQAVSLFQHVNSY